MAEKGTSNDFICDNDSEATPSKNGRLRERGAGVESRDGLILRSTPPAGLQNIYSIYYSFK